MLYVFRNTEAGTSYAVAVDDRRGGLERTDADRLMRELGADAWEAIPGAVASSLYEVLIDWSPHPDWLTPHKVERSS